MKYSFLETPFDNIVSVRDSDIIDSFRPAATGYVENVENLKIRAEMEAAENSNALASAAHFSTRIAIKNATDEYIERTSLAIWWHLKQPFIGKAETLSLNGFSFYHGAIRAVNKMGSVAVSMLEKQSEYPYFVLGSAYNDNAIIAQEKAFMESIQSWVGSQWMKNNGQPIYWDIEELARRKNQLINLAVMPAPTVNLSEYFHEPRIEIEHVGKIAVASVYYSDGKESNDSAVLAKLISGRDPLIFSRPNM